MPKIKIGLETINLDDAANGDILVRVNGVWVPRKANTTVALTDAATIAWDFSLGENATVTITTNRAISVSNDYDLAIGALLVTSASPYNLTLPAGDKAINGGDGVLAIPAGESEVSFKKWGSVRRWTIGSNFTAA